MRLVYKFRLTDDRLREELLVLCRYSKDLYNQTLYTIRTELDKNNKWLSYYDLNNIMQTTYNTDNEINYRKLKTQVAQQTIKTVSQNVSSYVKSIKQWKKHPEEYTAMPKFPRYLNKKGYFQLTYTNQCSTIKDGKIYFSKTLFINIPQYDKYEECIKNYQQIRIIPKKNGRVIWVEIVYDVADSNPELDYKEFASIDLGLNNLVTLVSSTGNPVIYNGRQIKAANQYMNKRISILKSKLATDNSKGMAHPIQKSKQTDKIYDDRNNLINDMMHKVSRHIVNYLIKNKIGTLVVGYNKGWKDSINIGKVNNQTFVGIPFSNLINMLKYKCERAGIILMTNEESYTSKCDSLAMEEICKHDEYKGMRVKRGLYQSSTGKLINADVNGALNILRKVVGDSDVIHRIIDSGLLFNPVKYRNLFKLDGCGL